MRVQARFKILAEKIKMAYPQLAPVKNPEDQKERIRRSIIGDIQQRLAEIYAVLEREVADDGLDLTYAEAMVKFPENVTSILNLISVLSLSTKTKLNINQTERVFDEPFIAEINAICLECYKITSILSGKADPAAVSIFNKGLTSTLEYTYYKIGISKR
jgi:hypothetical protein